MKKSLFTLFALLAITTGAKADVAINSSHFPDEAFRTLIISYYDFDKNLILDDNEIKQITAIQFVGQNIGSLKGIEYFTELTQLNCAFNQLKALNVSMNNKLETLTCINNQLTSLNVSGCPDLQYLYCSANKLETLNLSGCSSLEVLHCDANSIKGYGMTRLLFSLPMNTTHNEHKLYVLRKDDESNIITNDQLSVAKLLRWTVYGVNGTLETKKGDVNEDGTIDVADISTVINIMAGKDVETQPDEEFYPPLSRREPPALD